MISFAWRLLDIFETCIENDIFQIFKFTVFMIFFLFKSMNSTKNPKNSILCTLLHNFIQNTDNGNNYLNLPIKFNIMRYFFEEYIFSVYFLYYRVISIDSIQRPHFKYCPYAKLESYVQGLISKLTVQRYAWPWQLIPELETQRVFEEYQCQNWRPWRTQFGLYDDRHAKH